MKILTTARDLEATLCTLMRQYEHYRWAVAWASTEFPLYNDLLKHQRRISQIVVGTHFYQTHPDFLESFAKHPGVRFILQTDGVFHPKIYLFENDASNWACIMGSPNFTGAAFSQNTETAVLFDSTSQNAGQSYPVISGTLLRCWKKAGSITEDQIKTYRVLWKRGRNRLNKLCGNYGQRSSKALSVNVPLFGLQWTDFVTRVKADRNHPLRDRLDVLRAADAIFRQNKCFADMKPDERRKIGGFAATRPIDWGLFGSMRGALAFKKVIDHKFVSDALDFIPMGGMVTEDDFNNYLETFQKAFPNGGHGVAVATRLLCMKRPDMFVCFDSKNRTALCKAFAIPQTGMTYDRYWGEIIERVREAEWWNSPRPSDLDGQAIWDGRTALLDALYYDPKA